MICVCLYLTCFFYPVSMSPFKKQRWLEWGKSQSREKDMHTGKESPGLSRFHSNETPFDSVVIQIGQSKELRIPFYVGSVVSMI